MRGIISRFAPAPTGHLHLGHVVNAAEVWRETRARGGTVLLRIEDHDRQRSRRRFEDTILEDLAWLGFEADAPLVRQGLVYACTCTRTEIAAANVNTGHAVAATVDVGAELAPPRADQGRPLRDGAELCYPGTCRDRGLADGPGAGLRVRLDPSVERFDDLRLGAQEQRPFEQCGDLLVRDRDGNWTYQFAATVDDMRQAVTLVIRGVDLLASTGRQIQLARLLGRGEPPQFLHHPLIMKSAASAGGVGAPGQKLSKSDGDTGIRELRAAGWTPAQVIERALALVGGAC